MTFDEFDALARRAVARADEQGRADDADGWLVVAPRQPRIKGGPRPREVARNGEGRLWMWTVGQCRRIVAILDAHREAHEGELAGGEQR